MCEECFADLKKSMLAYMTWLDKKSLPVAVVPKEDPAVVGELVTKAATEEVA